MKIWFSCTAFCCAILPVFCVAQVDIYQSDAYSVEEMCARHAEQNTAVEYNKAYNACIEENGGNPMYEADQEEADMQSAEENDLDNNDWSDTQDRPMQHD